jgi:choline dehydrogenase
MFSYLNVRTTGESGRGMAGSGAKGLENVGGVGCVINKPRSTGWVRITSNDARELPHVEPNYLSETIDRIVMREIVKRGWDVLTSEPLASMLETPLGIDAKTVADDVALDESIMRMVASGYHFTSSCKMGARDKAGVVDQTGLVYGCKGLRIIDASVLPTIPAANPMLPIVMVAERLAAAAKESSGARK